MADYKPIKAVRTSSLGGVPDRGEYPEAATQTFVLGVPLVFSSGNLQEAGFGSAQIVAGISTTPGSNLTVAATAQELSEGTPQNQTSGAKIPVGARMRQGNQIIEKANGDTTFSISLFLGQVFTAAMVAPGTAYGLTKDSGTGFWYLDNTDTSGDNAVAECVGVDPRSDNSVLSAQVYFQFKSSLRAF